MSNFSDYITPAEAKSLGDERTIARLEKLAVRNRKCCNCDEKAWNYGDSDMCFTCTTGESDASNDYELRL